MLYYKALNYVFLETSNEFDTLDVNYSLSAPHFEDTDIAHFEEMLKMYPDEPVKNIFIDCEFPTNQFPWEVVYEIVRKDQFSNLPKRTESYFVFNSISDAEEWRTRSSNYVVCEVEVKLLRDSFTGDMYYLDCVDIHSSFNEIVDSVSNYWCGYTSATPIIETMLQGELRLNKIE